MELPGYIFWIWGATLVILLILTLFAVALLDRLFTAARQIDTYVEGALEAGKGIAQNTSHIADLTSTLEVGGDMVGTSADISKRAGAIHGLLADRAGG